MTRSSQLRRRSVGRQVNPLPGEGPGTLFSGRCDGRYPTTFERLVVRTLESISGWERQSGRELFGVMLRQRGLLYTVPTLLNTRP